jgi:hypothetical protein
LPLNAWHYLYKNNSTEAQQDNPEFRMKNMKRTRGLTDNFIGWQPLLLLLPVLEHAIYVNVRPVHSTLLL